MTEVLETDGCTKVNWRCVMSWKRSGVGTALIGFALAFGAAPTAGQIICEDRDCDAGGCCPCGETYTGWPRGTTTTVGCYCEAPGYDPVCSALTMGPDGLPGMIGPGALDDVAAVWVVAGAMDGMELLTRSCDGSVIDVRYDEGGLAVVQERFRLLRLGGRGVASRAIAGEDHTRTEEGSAVARDR